MERVAVRIIFFLMLTFGCATTASAQCVINGMMYPENAPDPADGCFVCDSAISTDQFSPRDCSGLATTPCQIAACRAGQCTALDLPEFTRCSEPMCEDGSITQSECDAAGNCQPDVMKRTCGGFGCADGTQCATVCSDNVPCGPGFECDVANQVCESIGEPDMGGNADMGSDMSSRDMGNVNNVNNINNVNNVNNENNENNANNANNQNNNNGNLAGGSGDGGCCATVNNSQARSLFVLFGVMAFGWSRRKKR